MIKLIATDMDGTLLDEHSQVPPETYELVEALREKGIIFVASSGRRYDTLRWFFKPVADKMDFVASLGCQVYADGKLLDREDFSYLGIQKLYQTCEQFDCLHMVLYDDAHTYILDDLSHYVRELDKDLPNAQRVDDPPAPDVSIIKAAVCCDRPKDCMDMTYVLERELGDEFVFMPSGDTWIDTLPRGINKATGLAQLMQYYGIERDEVVAFGDSMNDYAMLRYVGHPLVMGNALYAVQQIAERVIGTNKEYAVQQEIRKILGSVK
ncbi:Cof-type HAD-IIB family hydrolase [Atopobium sp. oral taxon 416]|uniref:Cof-type HAD-IIB family hydrolase n=1 Tax=Atopobium sp. oral taxon 416 TaxID=712157 RepID=UPI001BA94751|nr:HAD family hydrolase [Atopobium sp. oral taxon 416]QUC02934.1 HAD family phosphatase [Atopobium sp. oral taxon 416]